MSYEIFLFLQVKGSTIISYKHGIYELPHELWKDLRLRILGKTKLICWSAGPNQIYIITKFDQLAFLIYYFLHFEN